MAFYTSLECGYVNDSYIKTGCTTDYEKSDVKYVVDNWALNKIGKNNYNSVRLIKADEYIQLCEIEDYQIPSSIYKKYIPKYNWLNNKDYKYWTMSSYKDYNNSMFVVDGTNGNLIRGEFDMYSYSYVVRPVVELYKCAFDNSCVKDGRIIDNREVENNKIGV